jgi:type I restriction enzyme S subunit
MFLAIPTDSNEQTRILSILLSQDEIIEITQNQLSKLQSLKTGLIQDLLSGKVRVNYLKSKEANETALA